MKKAAKKTMQSVTATMLAEDVVITEVKIRITNQKKHQLTKTELREMRTELIRNIAAALGDLTYTNYGIDNIKLKI